MHTCICVQTHPNIRPIMDGIFAIFYFFVISEHFQILLFLKHGFKDKRFANLFRKVVKIPKA